MKWLLSYLNTILIYEVDVWESINEARLAQSVERETFNLKAKGSSPLSGEIFVSINNLINLKNVIFILHPVVVSIWTISDMYWIKVLVLILF